jgi:hypothetical protein
MIKASTTANKAPEGVSDGKNNCGQEVRDGTGYHLPPQIRTTYPLPGSIGDCVPEHLYILSPGDDRVKLVVLRMGYLTLSRAATHVELAMP